MRAARDIEEKFSLRKDSGNQSQIGKVCPAFVGIVQDHHVAWADLAIFDRRFDRQWHRTQMHRHVVALCNHVAAVIENRARIVPAFLDVRRKGCPFQRRTHFFGNRVKQAFEDFELYWVDLARRGMLGASH